jgi:hypothetical protein
MSKTKLFVYTILTLLQIFGILFCIYISFNGFPFIFITLTIINFTLDTIYLLVITYHEILNYKESRLYCFIKDTLFKFLFVMALMVCTAYWGFVYLGDKFISFQLEPLQIIFSVYSHFVVTVIIICDLFFTEHDCKPDYKLDMIILSTVWVFYAACLIILSKVYDVNLYPFLNFAVRELIMIFLVLFMFLFNYYQIFDYIITKRVTIRKMEGTIAINSEKMISKRIYSDNLDSPFLNI